MITDSFDAKDKPIISLRDFYGEQRHLADVCIVTFSKEISDAVRAAHACRLLAEIGACNGNIPIWGFEDGGKVVAFYLSPIGATMAGECVEDANWLVGATKFLFFGSAGSLDGEATAGRFVVPTDAYRDEGMSYHYAPPADYIKIKNHAKVKAVFDGLGVPAVEGKTWTTDAILRETVGQMKKRRAEGCLTVEMELAGVEAVCDYNGWDLFAFLATGDVLSEENYDVSGLRDANHNTDKFALSLEIARRI